MKVLRHTIETSLGELLGLAWCHRRLLVILFVAGGALAWLASFLITPEYHSFASILPRNGVLADRRLAIDLAGFDKSVELRPVNASNGQNLVILSSYKMREEMVDSLDLVNAFGIEISGDSGLAAARHEAVDRLRKATHFELSIYRDVLFIHVTTDDPELSTNIASVYLKFLQRENLRLYHRHSQQMVLYLEDQIEKLRLRFQTLCDETLGYYSERGLVDLEKQRTLFFSLLEGLEKERISIDLRLERARLDQKNDSPEVKRLEALSGIHREMLKIGQEERAGARNYTDNMGVVIDNDVDLEVSRLEKHMSNLERLEISLNTSLTAALMELSRDEIMLPVLDRPTIPAEPVWPKRWLLSLVTALIAPLVAYLGIVFYTAFDQIRKQPG
jgi:uncharacterized protein involved in exopolysaccharide biosynthesis